MSNCRNPKYENYVKFVDFIITTRKHSNRMHTDCTVTRLSSEREAMRPIVDRQ